MNNVTFNRGQGGLGRPLTGEDHFSGFLFYNNTLPSGFGSSDRIKKIFSVADAEALGIEADYSDETAATGTYLVTAIGVNGDTLNIAFAEPRASVDLGTYTKTASETTVALVATAIAAVINAGTVNHGYTATVNTATVTITARPGLGVFSNTGSPVTVTIVGTIAGTLTQPSGGVYSKRAIYHYHISEFFRMQPKGVLWVGIYAVPSSYDFTDLSTIQNYAEGAIRQFGVWVDTTVFLTAHVTAIQTVCNTMAEANMPASVLYGGDISATASVGSLTNLATLDSENVSVIIGQDGNGTGWELWKATANSITCVGAVLGTVALSKVSEDIAWVAKYNMSNGTELDTIEFANGQTWIAVSDSIKDTLDDYRYIFLRKFVGVAGSYFNDSHTATLLASDYAYIENMRTIDKAIRGLRVAYIPELNRPLTLNADGTMTDQMIAYLESVGDRVLEQMERDAEVSAFDLVIDSAQNVLSTNQVVVGVQIVPIGTARNIVVNIGFAASIS